MRKSEDMSESPTNIVLIGMPGAGKSTVGVVLAKILNKHFTDTDLLIQKRHDETLQNLIDALGPSGFIDIENELLLDVDVEDSVIATGGSAVYSEEGMKHLGEIGTVVYLRGTIDEISRRIQDFDERGIVFSGEHVNDLNALFEQRRPLYEKHADVTIDIDGKSVTDVAREIDHALRSAL